MVGSLIYSLVRVLLDVIATSHGDQVALQAEVLVLRRQRDVHSPRGYARPIDLTRALSGRPKSTDLHVVPWRDC